MRTKNSNESNFWNVILAFEEFEYIKIHTKDKIFTCIKKIFIENNKVFKAMLSNDNYIESNTNIIDFTEYESKYVKPLLDYIISNKFQIDNDEIKYGSGYFVKGSEIFEKEFLAYIILFEKFLIDLKSEIQNLFKNSLDFNFYKIFINLKNINTGDNVECIKLICLTNMVHIYLIGYIDKKYVSDKKRACGSIKITKDSFSFYMSTGIYFTSYVILNKEMTEEEISIEFGKIYGEEMDTDTIKEIKKILDNFILNKNTEFYDEVDQEDT